MEYRTYFFKGTYFFNYIRFYKWGISFNTWKLMTKLSEFIIKKKSKSLDNYLCKKSICYYETFRDFYDTQHGGTPNYE